GWFILPESLPPSSREAFSLRRANPLGSLALLRSRPQLFGLSVVILLSFLAHEVLPSTFVLYAGYRFGWDTAMVGMTLAGVGLCGAIVQGGLVRPVVARAGERRTLLTGLLFGALGMAIYGLAPEPELFWVGAPVMALWGFFTPSAQSLMTGRVSTAEQGRLQGALQSLRGITGLIGPVLFTATFALAIAPEQGRALSGAPFLLASGLLTLALILAWRVTGGAGVKPEEAS
ncbi:MAG: MFS transporter, partial [Rhodospirillaceae bacterium]